MNKIDITLSPESIEAAIRQLEYYKKRLALKIDELMSRLSEIGAKEASVRFTTAIYDGINDSNVTTKKIPKGYAIVAKGKSVAFIEFGAGVYNNGSEPYPNPPGRPNGIVGIGEYGKGRGKQKGWAYYDESGELVKTRGNPAAMPMWYATKEIESQVNKIAKEVFSGD